MAESIIDKTSREMVADRDRALAIKEGEIAGLREQIRSLSQELANAWKHPMSANEKATKRILSDYERTVELMESRMPDRKPLGELSLFDVVRNTVVALDMIRRDRNDKFHALSLVCGAADEAKKAIESP